jgi:hypothetical protein
VTVTFSLAPTTLEIVGVAGSASTTGDVNEGRESPIKFLAETLNSYALPAVNPVIVADVAVDFTSLNVVQVPEPATLYSIT